MKARWGLLLLPLLLLPPGLWLGARGLRADLLELRIEVHHATIGPVRISETWHTRWPWAGGGSWVAFPPARSDDWHEARVEGQRVAGEIARRRIGFFDRRFQQASLRVADAWSALTLHPDGESPSCPDATGRPVARWVGGPGELPSCIDFPAEVERLELVLDARPHNFLLAREADGSGGGIAPRPGGDTELRLSGGRLIGWPRGQPEDIEARIEAVILSTAGWAAAGGPAEPAMVDRKTWARLSAAAAAEPEPWKLRIEGPVLHLTAPITGFPASTLAVAAFGDDDQITRIAPVAVSAAGAGVGEGHDVGAGGPHAVGGRELQHDVGVGH